MQTDTFFPHFQDGLVNYSTSSEDSETEQEEDDQTDRGTMPMFFASPAISSLSSPFPTDFWRTTVSDTDPVCVPCESVTEVPSSPVTTGAAVARPLSPPWRPPEITQPPAPNVGIRLDVSAYRYAKKKRKLQLDPQKAARSEAEQQQLRAPCVAAEKSVAGDEESTIFESAEEKGYALYQRISFACKDLPPGSWNMEGFYPRCSVCWPFLAVSSPVGKSNDGAVRFGVQIWKFAGEPPTAHHVTTFDDPDSSPHGSGRIMWLRLLSKNWLAVAYETGVLCIWDSVKGQQILRINVSGCCGRRLRAVSADSDNPQPCFLVAGDAPCISLWDLRIGGDEDASRTRGPAQRFNYQGYAVSTSDLLWLAHSGHFASCTDTVQRDVTDKSVAVWDLRLQSIISRQLYQERWGCSRMALARTGAHSCRFAVQTQGGGIVEIVGGRDAKRQYRMRRNLSDDTAAELPLAPISYRLERRWRYEKHETQAHPLGLAYSPDNRLLASGCWGSDGPVVYRSPWRRDGPPHSAADKEAEPACLRLGGKSTARGVLISDVAWLPMGALDAPAGQALVAVRNNCDLNVYRVTM